MFVVFSAVFIKEQRDKKQCFLDRNIFINMIIHRMNLYPMMMMMFQP